MRESDLMRSTSAAPAAPAYVRRSLLLSVRCVMCLLWGPGEPRPACATTAKGGGDACRTGPGWMGTSGKNDEISCARKRT